jgi:hypothetical protein
LRAPVALAWPGGDAAAALADWLGRRQAALRERGVAVAAPAASGEAAELRRALAGRQVTLALLVERQDRYLESVYRSRVASARERLAEDMGPFLEAQLERRELDLPGFVAPWLAAFGKDALFVRAHAHGLDDLAAALGLPAEPPLSATAEAPLDPESLAFLRQLNSVPMDAALHERVLARLRERAGPGTAHADRLLTRGQRLALLAPFRESNRRFAREFLAREGALELSLDEIELDPDQRAYAEESFFRTLAQVFPVFV